VGVRVGVAYLRNKLALHTGLRNLNLRSQFPIFDSFWDIRVHTYDFLKFVVGLWSLKWAWKTFFCRLLKSRLNFFRKARKGRNYVNFFQNWRIDSLAYVAQQNILGLLRLRSSLRVYVQKKKTPKIYFFQICFPIIPMGAIRYSCPIWLVPTYVLPAKEIRPFSSAVGTRWHGSRQKAFLFFLCA